MTQEEKARAYDESLERAKKFNIDDAYASQGAIIKFIFPQIRESKDERIREEIIALVRAHVAPSDTYLVRGGSTTREEAEAWLEKQKEQKPAEWSEEDEEMLEYVIGDVNDAKELFATKESIDLCDKEIAWHKSLRSRPKSSDNWKPSEEQMKALQNAVTLTACDKELARLYNQLKKL